MGLQHDVEVLPVEYSAVDRVDPGCVEERVREPGHAGTSHYSASDDTDGHRRANELRGYNGEIYLRSRADDDQFISSHCLACT